MTMLWADGFEGLEYQNSYSWNGASFAFGTSTRFGIGRSFDITNANNYIFKSFTASTDVYVGFAIFATVNTSWWFALNGDSTGTQHLTLTCAADGSLTIRRGSNAGTALASSPAGTVLSNVWYYIEIHARVHDTTGIVEIRVNGATSNLFSYSGDTKNAGTNNTIDSVVLACGANGVTVKYDDLVVCNGLGAQNNTWFGDVRCQTLVPTGAGTSTGLTPSTGANWSTVDEQPASSTDYNGSSVSGTRDTYTTADLLPGTASVLGVRIATYMHKSDAGSVSMKSAMKIGGTNYYGATRLLGAGMLIGNDMYDVSPATSAAWTVSEFNGAEMLGAEVV